MMSITWILIANAGEARLFANLGPNKGLKLLKKMDHPASREKASELVSDRPGYNPGVGNGHGSYVPPPTRNSTKRKSSPRNWRRNWN
jgi:Protein required for attachment to host cells.